MTTPRATMIHRWTAASCAAEPWPGIGCRADHRPTVGEMPSVHQGTGL